MNRIPCFRELRGRAYVARDTLSSDLVIIKAMRDATDPRAIRTELELLKGFASYYCIRYNDAFEKDGRVWVGCFCSR